MMKVDRLLLCDCAGTMSIDADSAGDSIGAQTVKTCSQLCMGEIDFAARALEQDGTTLIACQQQAALFRDLRAEIDGPSHLLTADIRDRAGWTEDTSAHPKQAALLAETILDAPQIHLRDIQSDGVCLIIGKSADILPVADQLAETLSVFCLCSDSPENVTPTDRYDLALGQIRSAAGAFTRFEIVVDGFAQLDPSGRGPAAFTTPKDNAKSTCDIILDLRGETALFPAPDKRDGYLRADPRDMISVERAISRAAHLIGAFEKPLYIRFDESLCAHSRASQTGCNRCLDVCPTGAILSSGDTVTIDPDICAGCGACASVCPSGAASYDDPNVEFLFSRLKTLASTYMKAAGRAPRVLFHDAAFGAEMIALSARFGRGLPSDVIPIAVNNIETIGHAEILAALGVGFTTAQLLLSPKTDRAVSETQLTLAHAVISGTGRDPEIVSMIDVDDPEKLEEALYGGEPVGARIEPILPLGGRRNVTRLAASALANSEDPVIDLPAGAPYGALVIDTDACTLCLACVSLCPVGALGDNPDKPELRFQESACLQCGICKSTCPENAITLKPQLNLANEALSPCVLHEEDPFDCISCGKPFGVKSTIERITENLKDKHPMFTNSDNFKLIQMCDDCRVNAQFHQDGSPFKSADRPKVRTTQDYLDDREN